MKALRSTKQKQRDVDWFSLLPYVEYLLNYIYFVFQKGKGINPPNKLFLKIEQPSYILYSTTIYTAHVKKITIILCPHHPKSNPKCFPNYFRLPKPHPYFLPPRILLHPRQRQSMPTPTPSLKPESEWSMKQSTKSKR